MVTGEVTATTKCKHVILMANRHQPCSILTKHRGQLGKSLKQTKYYLEHTEFEGILNIKEKLFGALLPFLDAVIMWG